MSATCQEEIESNGDKEQIRKKKSKTNGKCLHRVYGNLSKKKPFAISQSTITDDDHISQRLQLEWFERGRAQLQLRYF